MISPLHFISTSVTVTLHFFQSTTCYFNIRKISYQTATGYFNLRKISHQAVTGYFNHRKTSYQAVAGYFNITVTLQIQAQVTPTKKLLIDVAGNYSV